MSDELTRMELRPRLKGYLWAALVLLVLWFGFDWLVVPALQANGIGSVDMRTESHWKIAGVIGLLGLFYGAHWGANADTYGDKRREEYRSRIIAEKTEKLAEQARTYSLEIRGSGLAVHRRHQTEIWQEIEKKKDNFASIYSQDPNDYDPSFTSRRITQDINVRVAFKHAASDSVAYWPIPVFAIAPPKQPEDIGAANNILEGRNAATLGVTLFLWQDAENTTHAQSMIERLFEFFDTNPQVPQALIVSEDGDLTRNNYRVAGTPGVPKWLQVVPTVFESMTGLLVTRSDRVDRYIRPYVTYEIEDNQNKNTDLGKLWFFYWERGRSFRAWYEAAEKAKGVEDPQGPSTMSSAYWHTQLPDLWRTLSNRGSGDFTPSPWLPARWARHQVDEFDAAPVLGYSHRPIKTSMHDEAGKLLKPALQANAVQAAWLQALNTLPKGQKPARVFYDSTDNTAGEIALTNALHALNVDGHGLELGNVEEGYDIGRRLGNTGVSSALVQINLATMASYQQGGASAVVYSGKDGSVTVQMVSPPNEERKVRNHKNRGNDPFKYGAPGGKP